MTSIGTDEIPQRLAFALRTRGPLTSRELQVIAGVSQPQISRYLRRLGSDVLKIGRGKNVQYVHTRIIPQVGYKAPLFNVDPRGKLAEGGVLYSIYPKGFYWLSTEPGRSRIFDDLPFFLNDLRPSGFLGRLIPRTHPEWEFPEDVRFWSAESTMKYLTHFGYDLVGDQIIGEIAARKFIEESLKEISNSRIANEIEKYEELALQMEAQGVPGSSAGGEHPKFVTRRPHDGAPVIVKFAAKNINIITQRRVDLLRAEHLAAILLSEASRAASTRLIEGDKYIFLEIARFDRVLPFGRKGIISLFSLDAEFVGSGESWGVVAQKLSDQNLLDRETVKEIIFREYFGHFIGNTDMHGGNLSFFFERERITGLTPIYDMLPMKYAPIQERLSSDTISPPAPSPANIAIWERAKKLAIRYWQQVQATPGFASAFIEIAQRNERYLLDRFPLWEDTGDK